MNRLIKFKTNIFKKPVIDWKYIKKKEEVNKKSNVNLRNRLKTTCNYTEFNDAILCSVEETAMIKNSEGVADEMIPTLVLLALLCCCFFSTSEDGVIELGVVASCFKVVS